MWVFFLFTAPTAHADTGIIDPDGDGTIAGNAVTCGGGGNFECVNDAVRDPSAPSTFVDYIDLDHNDTDYLTIGTIASINNVSQLDIYVYHSDTGSNEQLQVALFDDLELTQYGSTASFNSRTSAQWDTATFSGLSLTQSQFDNLRIRINGNKNGTGAPNDSYVYALYAVVTYTGSGSLTVDIVDGAGSPVATPSVTMETQQFSFDVITSIGTLGTTIEKIRVDNGTGVATWDLTIAATNGSTSLWSSGSIDYDFNDPTVGAGDGGDADAVGGQLTIDPSVGTITPQGGCSTTGLSLGSLTAFSEGVTDSITLASTDNTADTSCYWDITGIGLSQDIPAVQSIGVYTVAMTLTVS